MKFEDIYKYYETPQPTFLNQELATCYVLSVLLQHNSYGTELIQKIEQDHPNYRVSDTTLYAALQFLQDEQVVTSYWQKVQGRGRPRRIYQIVEGMHFRAAEFASLWLNYMKRVPVAELV